MATSSNSKKSSGKSNSSRTGSTNRSSAQSKSKTSTRTNSSGRSTSSGRSASSGKSSSGRTASSNRSNYNRSSNSTYNKSTYNRRKKKNDPKRSEIRFYIIIAVSVFVLCSNFGICGAVGNFFANILFGLFGTVEYVLPIYLFLSAAFLMANDAERDIVQRVCCIGFLLIDFSFIMQMIDGFSGKSMKILYDSCSEGKNGAGAIFGSLLVFLHKGIGNVGCVILIACLGIIGLVLVLDVSFIEAVKNKLEEMSYYDDEDDEDDDDEVLYERRPKDKSKVSMKQITVLGDNSEELEEAREKKKRKKNRVVPEEEIHELKPEKDPDMFDIPVPKVLNKDFFDVNDIGDSDSFADKDMPHDITKDFEKEIVIEKPHDITEDFEPDIIDNAVEDIAAEEAQLGMVETVQEEKPKKQRKTKESAAEVEKQTEEIADVIEQQSENDEVKKEYQFPPLDLLKGSDGKAANDNDHDVKETAIKLRTTLANFGVKVSVTAYSRGPAVTRYELQPEMGVKVSKIVNLADDIKLNLAAADIRIEAPIPGKAAVGIEVPNKESSPVYFRDLLESDQYQNFKANLAFAVGKDISGETVVADIAKMPHLLVAGATGSGKSVCINTLIMSILYKARPEDVKLIMVDPKQVELSVYNGIPHMLIPVVTDPKKAAGALNWAVVEMTNRYNLFSQYNVRNLEGYNKKVLQVTGKPEGNEELKKLPQIVIIVDELADLMMVAHGEVEDAIVRLSQLARAAGIHLVIATQRPSVDVITGLIKANVPSRIAMTVSSGVDSRTIIDMVGAEKLLGKGDMLFYPTGYPKPVRVQGAFLSDDEISRVVDFIKDQSGETTYDEKITAEIDNSSVGGGASQSSKAESEYDEYFALAGKFIIDKDKASIGMLQRVYKIGFNRAARIMDQLSDAGVVGPEEGTKPRKVLMTAEEFENFVENNL